MLRQCYKQFPVLCNDLLSENVSIYRHDLHHTHYTEEWYDTLLNSVTCNGTETCLCSNNNNKIKVKKWKLTNYIKQVDYRKLDHKQTSTTEVRPVATEE